MGYVGNEPDVGFTSFAQQTITGNGGTSYTLSHAVANGKEILLYINNIKQEEGSSKAYTASGTTLTLSEAISSSDSCYCVFLGKALQTTVAPDGSVTSAKLANANLEMPNTLDMNGNELILDADGDTSITADTDDQIDFKTGGSDRVTIDSSGNVGIGTSSMGSETFVVEKSSGTPTIRINAPSGSEAQLKLQGDGTATDTQLIAAGTGGALIFSRWTGSAYEERMRIRSDARITTLACANTNGFLNVVGEGGTSNKAISFAHTISGGEVGSIKTSSSSTNYDTTSDYRLKENVVTDWDATSRLKQLKPSRFNFIADADTTVDGFLAHEVSSIVPEAITGEKDAVDANGNPDYQGIDHSKLVPLLTKALQEAMARIETLEAKVTALEGN